MFPNQTSFQQQSQRRKSENKIQLGPALKQKYKNSKILPAVVYLHLLASHTTPEMYDWKWGKKYLGPQS